MSFEDPIIVLDTPSTDVDEPPVASVASQLSTAVGFLASSSYIIADCVVVGDSGHERLRHRSSIGNGRFNGYQGKRQWHVDSGSSEWYFSCAYNFVADSN